MEVVQVSDTTTPYGDPDWGTDGSKRDGRERPSSLHVMRCIWERDEDGMWHPGCRKELSVEFPPVFSDPMRTYCGFCGHVANEKRC